MILNELIQRIQSLYSHGVQSDDSRLSPRHIYNKLLTVRNKLVYDKLEAKKRLSEWNYQTISCVEMIKVPNHECSCLVPTGCEVIRSKYKIPKPMTFGGLPLIKYVSQIDKTFFYRPTSIIKNKYNKGNKFTSDKAGWFIENQYLYLTQKFGPLVLTVSGLFEDPIEVENFPQYCPKEFDSKKTCESPLDKEFPIDIDLIEPMIQLTVDELIRMFTAIPEDLTNDTKDSQINAAK